MREYLPAWQAIPKLAISAAFVLEMVLFVLGERESIACLHTLLHLVTSHFSGASLLVGITLLFVVGAGLGEYMLGLIKASLNGPILIGLARGARLRRFRSVFESLRDTPSELALRRFRERPAFYVEFLSLKGAAMATDHLDKMDDIERLAQRSRKHIEGTRPSDMDVINFYGMLSQDRRVVERLVDEIDTKANLIVVILLFPAVAWSWCTFGGKLSISVAALITAGTLALDIARRKHFLGGILLAAYLDYFCVAESAEVADREGEPIL